MAETRTRKKNFTQREVDKLVDCVSRKYKVVCSKFSDTVTLQKKQETWKEIARKINAIAPCFRTVAEIRKKWDDLKMKAKKDAASKKRVAAAVTGNLPLSDTPLESDDAEDTAKGDTQARIVGLLGLEAVDGIEGGFDTAGTGPHESPKAKVGVPTLGQCIYTEAHAPICVQKCITTLGNAPK